MESSNPFASKKCKPCEGGTRPFSGAEVAEALKTLPGWVFEKAEINKTFTFKNFYETMAFVNAAAFIAHQEDHHPEIEAAYKSCRIRYSTHAIGGVSENDLICAAKIEQLIKQT